MRLVLTLTQSLKQNQVLVHAPSLGNWGFSFLLLLVRIEQSECVLGLSPTPPITFFPYMDWFDCKVIFHFWYKEPFSLTKCKSNANHFNCQKFSVYK